LNFTEDDVTDLTPESRAAVLELVRKSRFGAIYTPPSLAGTVVHPGFRGGVEWGGASIDPVRNRLFVNSDEGIDYIRLAPAAEGRAFKYDLPERKRLRDPEGFPAIKPPWGYMTAIDLDSGDVVWRLVNGEVPELKARGVSKTGSHSTGGSVATAGGLVFIAGTMDETFKAFDADSGEIVWEYKLPTGAYANPCSYEVNGKQYITIACGGGKGMSKPGDEFVTFSL
jgi:quinoprotein glucose dehydrogenase